jgi:hypothetical protein
METLPDIVARGRRSDHPALVVGEDRERSYHELLTNAYKAGNVLRYHGVGDRHTVAVAPVPAYAPVLAFFGAAQLGAATRFDPVAGVDAGDRLVLVPGNEQTTYDPAPGSTLAVFGGDPDDAETVNWEESVWSENPAFPPTDLDPETTLLVDGDREVSHGRALAAAAEVAERYGLDVDSRVVLRESLDTPEAVVVGLLTPLTVGGTAVLASPEAVDSGGPERGGLAVTTGEAPEPTSLVPADVPLSDH